MVLYSGDPGGAVEGSEGPLKSKAAYFWITCNQL
jgi:hypothetical protein